MKKMMILTMLLSALFSFNVYAMNNEKFEITLNTPATEQKSEEPTLDFKWVWLNDDLCVRTKTFDSTDRDNLLKRWDLGIISRWSESDVAKTRDTYSGKWSQDTNGIKSFIFDDYTIPVGPTNIDGVVYAFNGYGQLMDGYNYWGDLKTGPDGLVATDNPEFTEWLSTQYLPECTSHE